MPGNPNEQNVHYLKPAAFIIQETFLVYAGLKPFASGIQKPDGGIIQNTSTTFGFLNEIIVPCLFSIGISSTVSALI